MPLIFVSGAPITRARPRANSGLSTNTPSEDQQRADRDRADPAAAEEADDEQQHAEAR